MRHWLLMFRPDTYEDVKAHGTIGVRYGARKRFQELSDGDRLVAYVSQVQLLDGYGVVRGEPFVDDEPIFTGDKLYRHRCRAHFEETGLAMAPADTFWQLETFSMPMNTTPVNLIYCRGGFTEITAADYERLLRVMKGEEDAPVLEWKQHE